MSELEKRIVYLILGCIIQIIWAIIWEYLNQ